MNNSSRNYYVIDLYHQPPGYSQPVVREQHRITARSDAEGISEAQAIFIGQDKPLVTGFALRADSERSRPLFRDDLAHHSDLISLGVPR
jgi:hypothetical protein